MAANATASHSEHASPDLHCPSPSACLQIFTGNSQSIFKGVVSWIASLLITVVAFHMLKFYNVERKWRRKLEGAMDGDRQVRVGC